MTLLFLLIFQYLILLAVAYEKTQELARDLRGVGCGDLDVEGTYLRINYYVKYIDLFFITQVLINMNGMQHISVYIGISLQSRELRHFKREVCEF